MWKASGVIGEGSDSFPIVEEIEAKKRKIRCAVYSKLLKLTIMCKEKIHTAFSNMEAILRLFLGLMVTNCSGKRSFSRCKSIKNKLRSTMSQERFVCTEHSVH